MKFAYDGFDAQGERQSGLLEATNKIEALRELQRKAITLSNSNPRNAQRPRPAGAPVAPPAYRPSVTRTDAPDRIRSFDSRIDRSDDRRRPSRANRSRIRRNIARAAARRIFFRRAIRCGLPLPDYLLHLVRAGELTGDLAGARAQEKMEYDERTANDLRNTHLPDRPDSCWRCGRAPDVRGRCAEI